MTNNTKGILIAAPASGSGKTTVTLGLMRALLRQGHQVQPFKCGPDYIDPAFHQAACNRPSRNLDSWAMSPDMLRQSIMTADEADFVIAEGSMGLFDGVAMPGETGNGASADLAALAGWPVVLVLDCSGQAQSAAAIVAGFAAYREDVHVAGVILNKIASPRHENLVRAGMQHIGIPVLGALPRLKDIEMPERHLGLVQASEMGKLQNIIDAMADLIEDNVDIAAIGKAASCNDHQSLAHNPADILPPGQRIALARDAAFTFVYPHILDAWSAKGAEILPFSPLNDEAPAADADSVWLAGGYPELHAGRLAEAERFKAGLMTFAQTRPVHGECGGYMVLGQGLVDKDGHRHAMTGLLGLETSFAKRKFNLGYRKARLESDALGYRAGQELRGHEFHYSSIQAQPDQGLATVVDANGAEVAQGGSRRGLVTGTFFHLIGPAS